MPVKLFISYAHDEFAYKDELVKALYQLERDGLIRIWTDEEIVPGQEWDVNIRGALLKAGIIIFLVSKKFISSRYIKEVELKDATERYSKHEVVLIPVILENIEKDLMDLLPLNQFEPLPVVNKKVVPVNDWTPQSGAYSNILNGIQRAIGNLPASQGPYADVVPKLRALFKQSMKDDIFKELEKMEGPLQSLDMDLYNTYLTLRASWKKVRLSELRHMPDAEGKTREFNYELIDFITSLEKTLEEKE